MAGRQQLLALPTVRTVPAETAGVFVCPDGVLPHVSSREPDVVIPSRGIFRRAYSSELGP